MKQLTALKFKTSLPWILVFLVAFFEVYAAFIIKRALPEGISLGHPRDLVHLCTQFLESPWLLSGLLTYFLAPALWFVALSKLDISKSYPVLVALHFLFVFMFGTQLLHEPLEWNRVLGSVFLILSILCFMQKDKTTLRSTRRLHHAPKKNTPPCHGSATR